MKWEILLVVGIVIGMLAVSAAVKHLCRKYMKGRNDHDDQ